MSPIRRPSLRVHATLRGRLLAGSVAVLALLLVSALVSMRALGVVYGDMRSALVRSSSLATTLFQEHDATLRYVATAQSSLIDGDARHAATADSLSNVADSLRRVLLAAEELPTADRAVLERIGGLQGRIEVRLAVARAWRDVGQPGAMARQATLAAEALDTLFAQAQLVGAAQERRADETAVRTARLLDTRRLTLGAIFALGLLLATMFGVWTWRAVTDPLGRLTDAARRLRAGDLRVSVDDSRMAAEYRLLATTFDGMAQRLRELLGEVQSQAADVAHAAEALTSASEQAASEQAASSTGQISEAMAGVARGAEAQRHELASSERIIGDVGGSARSLGEAAQRSRALAATIDATAAQARGGIEQAIAVVARAGDVIGGSRREVEGLEQAFAQVTGFVVAIESIAQQTNLLALNAAIEAARAGDAGRGFAVVADEVRKLAEESARAAGEVGAMVATVRDRIATTTARFSDGIRELGDVSAVSRGAVAALTAIDSAVAGVNDVAGAVAEAATSHATAVQELARRVAAAGGEAEAQATASEQAAAASEETAATAQEVAATAEELAGNAQRLEALLSGFQV